MSARSVVLVLALLASCGFDDVSAGVEVVPIVDESRGVDDPVAGRPARDQVVGVADDVEVVAGPGAEAAVDGVDLDPAMPATVAVIGDSLALSAEDEIEAALADLGLEVLVVDAVESRRMTRGGSALPPGTDAIEAVLDSGLEPELWVIALGTNDVGAESSPESFGDDVAAVLTRVPAGVPVIWIDVWIRDRATASAEANRAIRSVSALRPATLVVDWYGHGDDPGIVIRDGVHLSDAGQRLFAATMASAVESMFGG